MLLENLKQGKHQKDSKITFHVEKNDVSGFMDISRHGDIFERGAYKMYSR